MKKKLLLTVIAMCVVFGGCSNGVSQEEYNKVVAERDEYKEEIENQNSSIKKIEELFSYDNNISVSEAKSQKGKILIIISHIELTDDPDEWSENFENALLSAFNENYLDYDYVIGEIWNEEIGMITSGILSLKDGDIKVLDGTLYDDEEDSSFSEQEADTSEQDVIQSETTEQPPLQSEPEMTLEQKNALDTAKSYLSTMAFSYSGLIEQLEFEGYSTESATYAADNCGADWNEQAAKMAQNYIDTMSFSRSGLIEQLEFEGFTAEQAEYGVTAVGY